MGKRHALLVATARYADAKLRDLRAPVHETQLLAQLLLDPAIGEFDSAPVLLDNRKGVIEYEIERLFNDRSPDDLVLLYLSGHGFKNADNQLFFAANDTETNRPYSTAIPSVLVRQLLAECQSRNKAVLLDCCYSGMFSRAAVSKSAEGVELDASLGKGTYVITATNELDLAYEDERVVFDRRQPYSRFTDALITGLTTGAAPRPARTSSPPTTSTPTSTPSCARTPAPSARSCRPGSTTPRARSRSPTRARAGWSSTNRPPHPSSPT